MAAGGAAVYLPDGQFAIMPPYPRTWVDQAPGVRGDSVRAPLLELDAGGGVLWHRQRPLFQGFQALAQSIPTSTWTAITGLSEVIDNYGGHSDTANTGRYYSPATGTQDWHLCSGLIPWSSNDSAHVHISGLRKNGSATIFEGSKIPSGTGHGIDTLVIDLVQLGANDYVELCGWQNTGSSVNTIVTNKNPSLTTRWVATDPAGAAGATPALPSPHAWTAADWPSATATGTSGGYTLVPLNREVRDVVAFLNNPPLARLTASGTSQTIPSGAGTWTSINYTASGNLDSYSGWAIGNPSRYVCQRAGLYLVAGQVAVAEPAAKSGYRAARLLQTLAAGGTTTYAGWSCLPMTGTATTGTSIYAIAMVRMAAGDYVETQMSHTQGGALTVSSTAGGAPRMLAVWMAA